MHNLTKLFIILILILQCLLAKTVTYEQIKHLIINECHKYPAKIIHPYLIRAMMFYESGNFSENFDTRAISSKDCIGLMQISDEARIHFNEVDKRYNRNHKDIQRDDLFDIEINIKIGIWILTYFLEQCEGDICKALRGYSGNATDYDRNVLSKALKYFINER